MAEDKDLDKVIAKRKELAILLQQEGNLSAQRAQAISEQYNTLEEISNITKTINTEGKGFVDELNKAVDAGTGLYDISLGLVESLKESLGIQSRRNEFDRDLFKVNRDITNTLREQKENLYTEQDVSKQIAKNDEKRLAALKVSKSLTAGMSEESLKQVQNAQDVYLARQDIEKIIKAELDAVAAGAPYDAEKLARLETSARSLDNSLETQLEMLSPMQQQLLYTNMNIAGLDEINAKQKERLERIQEINKAAGLTGSIIQGLSKLPGLDRIFKASDVEDVKKALLDSGKEANKFQIAGELAKKTFGNLRDTLTDPAFLFTAVTDALVRNSKLTNQFQTELGVSYGNALAMRQEIANAADASGELFINSEKLQKSVFALAENTGVFFDLSSQSAETFTVLTDRMGLAANEAANLTMLARLQGKDTETTMSNIVGTANAALATSKTTANVKDILGDMAKTSKGLQASFAANPGALAKAAVAARELGATLKDMEATQKNLLNFENSINAELEAELLTGKQLNLEKARTAALNNDLETVGKELMNQGVDLASFGEMNYLQQEKIAAAMGMTRDAMGEMLLKQQTQGMAAEEVRKKFGEQAYEQFKAMDASEKTQAAMAKLKDIFANILQFVTPLIDGIAMLLEPIALIGQGLAKLSEWTGGWSSKILGAIIIVKMLGMELGGMGKKFMGIFNPSTYTNFFKGLQQRFTGVTDSVKGLGSKIKETFTSSSTKGVTDAAAAASPKNVAGAANAAGATGATPAPSDNGQALKEKMQNIAEGIKSFANGDTLKGAFNMLVSAPGLIALGLASAPLKITEKLDGKTLQKAMQGIAQGIKSFDGTTKGSLALLLATPGLIALGLAAPGLALIGLVGAGVAVGMQGISTGLTTLGNNFGSVVKGALALSFLAIPIAAAAAAFSLLKGIDAGAMIAFSVSLGILGTAAAILGNLLPQVVLGALALTTLALPIAAVSFAFSLLKGIDVAAITSFSVALGVLGLAAAGFGMIAPLILAGSFALTALALPITAVSLAFSMLQGVDAAAITSFSVALGTLGLAAAGFGLMAPLIVAGALALTTLALPIAAVSLAFSVLQGVDPSMITNFAFSLGILATTAALMGPVAPFIIAGSVAIAALGVALLPLSLAGEGISMLADGFVKVAESIQLMDVGKIATLAIAVVGLTASLVGLMALGPIGLTALAVVGGVAAVGAGVAAVSGGGAEPTGGAAVSTATAGETAGEDMRAMVEETVTATIKALVPEMVAALKEGQGNIRVTSDPFSDSKQSGQPSVNRRINSNSNLIS